MSKNQASPAFVLLLLLLSLLVASSQNKVQAQPRVIKPSLVVQEIYAKKQKNPQMPVVALAAYGNALIKNKGLDFSILDCAIAEANGKNGDDGYVGEAYVPFKYGLEDLSGKKISFQIMSRDWNYPCGCNFEVPVRQVNHHNWTVFAGNRQTTLKRPKDFYFEEVKLVDNKTFKKTVKSWYKPMDNEPVGISFDGTKIYVDLSYDEEINLWLEISDDGTFRIVPKNTPNIIKKEVELTDAERQKDEDSIGIKHFKSKNKSYYLKFDVACT
ncbi:MAG TPA: hypothetical protein VF604_20795 [Pyrinomonadaceae bacterium]|jgi:hypothetical protein